MRSWLYAVVFALFPVSALAVYYGETRAEVIKELGKPTSALTRGVREILIYPNGGRIELEGGKVVVVQGLAVTEGPVADAPATEPAAAPPVAPAEKAETAEEKATRAADEKAQKEMDAEQAKQRAELEKAIDDLGNQNADVHEPVGMNWIAFLTEILVKALLTLAALKLTTKYWDFDIEWSGLAIAAGADTAVRLLLAVIGEVVFKLSTMFFLDEIAASLVLVAVIRKVSPNKNLGRAVTIVLTSKTFSIVVGSMVAVAVMQGLF